MTSQVFSRAEALVFYGLSLVLIFSVMLYRADLAFAQGDEASADAPVLTPRPTQIADDDDDGDDDDGLDPPTDDDDDGLLTFTFTVRQGDTLSHIALYLGVSLESLAAQTDNPSLIFPGQKFTYRRERRIDTPPMFTDNDGTDSDGYDTPPPTDNPSGQPIIQQSQPRVDPPPAQSQQQRIDTPAPTDNDGTDSDGYDTPAPTDNDGTDSDGYDTPPPTTDNDDSDGYDTPAPTDNDGTDSDGYDTPPPTTDNDDSDSSDSD